jgi:hypothetical protein
MRPFVPIAAGLALFALPAVARAQEPEPRPQQRVMVMLTQQREVEGWTPGQRIRGTLLAMDADSLTIQVHPGTGPLRVSRGAVRRVYVSRGVPSRATSAVVGAVGGAVLGALTSWVSNDGSDRVFAADRDAAVAGAAIGAGIGLLGGGLFPREHWRRVHLPAGVSVAPPVRAGQGWQIALAR